MKIRFVKSLAIAIAMVAGSTTFGQDYFEGTDSEIEAVSYLAGGDKGGKSCDGGGKGCDSGCRLFDTGGCGGGAFYGGAEIIFIKAHSGTSEAFYLEDAAGNGTVRSFNWNYDPAFRVWAGYENDEGFGARARYFYYDQDAKTQTATAPAGGMADRGLGDSRGDYVAEAFTNPGETIAAIAGLHIEAVDMEATQRIDFCTATTTLSGGVRYGQLKSVVAVANVDQGVGYLQQSDFEGWGPTVALNARRPIRNGNLSLVAGMRSSVLFGNSSVTVLGLNQNSFSQFSRNNGVFIGEVRIGVSYARCLNNGIQLVGRAGWEGQYWAGMPLSTSMGYNFSDPSQLFMSGFSVGLGFLR